MIRLLLSIACLCFSNISFALSFNEMQLPEKFIIYTNGTEASRFPENGFIKTILPVNNEYPGYPGCYVGCYSKVKTGSIYSPSPDTHVMGLMRVSGSYVQQFCVPIGYIRQDITNIQAFREMCQDAFPIPCQNNRCWAEPRTGYWLGIIPR